MVDYKLLPCLLCDFASSWPWKEDVCSYVTFTHTSLRNPANMLCMDFSNSVHEKEETVFLSLTTTILDSRISTVTAQVIHLKPFSSVQFGGTKDIHIVIQPPPSSPELFSLPEMKHCPSHTLTPQLLATSSLLFVSLNGTTPGTSHTPTSQFYQLLS